MNAHSGQAPIAAIGLDHARRSVFTTATLPDLIRIIDIFLIALSASSSWFLVRVSDEFSLEFYVHSIAYFVVIYIFVSAQAELFSLNAIMQPSRRSTDVIISVLSSALFIASIVFATDMAYEGVSNLYIAVTLSSCSSILIGRFLAFLVLRSLSDRNVLGRRTMVLGTGEQSRRFIRHLIATKPYFLSLGGVFRLEGRGAGTEFAGLPVLGDIEDLIARVRAGDVDDVVIALPWSADETVLSSVERLKELPINVFLSSDLAGYDLAFRPVAGSLRETPIFEVIRRPIAGWGYLAKALEDYVLAALAVLVLSPLMLLIAALIKLDSPGPVLFRQKRLGFNNEVFEILKFRSMRHRPVEEAVVRQARRGDPRVTRIGRFLRASSLDELPQLFNVLNGTMSLVGPRPHALSHNEEYGRQIRGYFARHRVKPGITGWAQVNGFRGETETIEKMTARIEMDVYYCDNWSLLLDIRIMIKTFFVFLFQRGAY